MYCWILLYLVQSILLPVHTRYRYVIAVASRHNDLKLKSCTATATTTGTTLVTTTKSSTVTSTTSASSTTSSTIATTTSTTTSTTTASSVVSAISSYATTDGMAFIIDGKPTYFMGTNTYYIGFLTDNADVDLIMGHIAATGLKVLRVWGFNDVNSIPSAGTVWFQSFVSGASPVINTGVDGLQRLDYVVQSAEAHGISLIINFVNNWTNYGGMAAYCTYYGISPVTAWYTNAAAQAQYKAYIAAVVARYKTSTAVFAWELANEPRCTGCSTDVLTTWIADISAYIKSLDSNHMVCIGEEGFGVTADSDGSYPFTTGPGTNFTANLNVSTIDFGTYHLYPSSWGEADTWGPLWIKAHATEALALGKPVILEEYGSLTLLDELPWIAEVLATDTAGLMYWQYGDDLSTGLTNNDGYAIYYGSADYTTLVSLNFFFFFFFWLRSCSCLCFCLR